MKGALWAAPGGRPRSSARAVDALTAQNLSCTLELCAVSTLYDTAAPVAGVTVTFLRNPPLDRETRLCGQTGRGQGGPDHFQ